jgi:NAD(P)-dependent dehydrogenase (short-subunit alcohol dehydrogenase family)
MMLRFDDRTVVVSGAAIGIGRAIAKGFASMGASGSGGCCRARRNVRDRRSFQLTMHPHVTAAPSRIWILEELVRYAASKNVLFATHADVARYVSANGTTLTHET